MIDDLLSMGPTPSSFELACPLEQNIEERTFNVNLFICKNKHYRYVKLDCLKANTLYKVYLFKTYTNLFVIQLNKSWKTFKGDINKLYRVGPVDNKPSTD